MSATPVPSSLFTIVTSNPPASIDEVIQIMERLDAELTENDGLKWFNLLYLEVTQQVQQHPPVDDWKAPIWLSRLDVIFATLYFKAIADSLSGNPIPSSWQALFEARQRTGIDRIQFALAGMNAHINHDLALALLAIDSEMHQGFSADTPEHQDYEHVNDLLQAVLPQALTLLALESWDSLRRIQVRSASCWPYGTFALHAILPGTSPGMCNRFRARSKVLPWLPRISSRVLWAEVCWFQFNNSG